MNAHPEFAFTSRATYPDRPGCKSRLDTTQRAADAVEGEADTLRRQSLEILRGGDFTADEIAERLCRSILSIRPRVSELRKKGLIEPTAERRPNRSGHSAVVWKLTPKGSNAL